jgi:hypothetical protein
LSQEFVVQLTGAIPAAALLVVATALEVSGDAIVRIALQDYSGVGLVRVGIFVLGGALLFGYGTFLNLAPLEFREVVGLYIATLFVIWQILNFAFFRTVPTFGTIAGGALIVIGGLIVSFARI